MSMRVYDLWLEDQARMLRLTVPAGTARDDLVQSVRELAGLPDDARLQFLHEGVPLAFSSALHDGARVTVKLQEGAQGAEGEGPGASA